MCKDQNIECVLSKDESEFTKEWDLVLIPSTFIPPARFPNTKRILYGPQEFIFVNGLWKKNSGMVFPPHCFYNLLSDWVVNLQNEFGGLSLPSKCLPFAVDTEGFQPSPQPKTDDCLIYFKRRKLEDLEYVLQVVKQKNLHYSMIKYGSYTEEDFLNALHKAKFCIWIGCHESQGFAVQEALSCNVPLLVILHLDRLP